MFYKLNEVGELMKGEITISSEGINIGWLEFETDWDAANYFLQYGNTIPFVPVTLDDFKKVKKDELQNTFNEALKAGYTNTDFNITLALQREDMTSFNDLLTILRLADELGITQTEANITDINGVLHTLTVTNVKILLLQYGSYYQSLWANLVYKKNAVNSCISQNDLELISW